MAERLEPSDFRMTPARHHFSTKKIVQHFNPEMYWDSSLAKFAYLQHLTAHDNHSVYFTKSCVTAFVSLVSNPVWLQIDCSHSFKNLYFLCERLVTPAHSRQTHLHSRKDVSCRKNTIYISGTCWRISRYRSPRLTDFSRVATLMSVRMLLTSWSLSNISRYGIRVRVDGEHGCLERQGFQYQRLVNWRYWSNCTRYNSTSHYLSSTTIGYFKHPCKTSSHFLCSDGTCILSSYICDGYVDCVDKNDEENCAEACNGVDQKYNCYHARVHAVSMCGEMYHRCTTSHECVGLIALCDSQQDCQDSSDEILCSSGNGGLLTIRKSAMKVNIICTIYY